MEQVGSKTPLLGLGCEIAVGCSDDPHVHAVDPVGADTLDLA